MNRPNVFVSDYMSKSPHTVGAEQSLSQAHDIMRNYCVRHLPVLHGGRLVGMLSIRDLHLVETLPDTDPSEIRVEEAMTPEPFSVRPDAKLADVAARMADDKLGAVVVTEDNRVVGVLTTIDALRALADALRS